FSAGPLSTMPASSPSARWCSFRHQLETPGCWTPPTTSLHDSPEMGTPSPSTSKKPTPTSQSAGKVTTTLKVAHSSTQTEKQAGSSQSFGYHTAKIAQMG